MAKQRLSVEQFIATGKSSGGTGTEIEFSEFLTGSGVGGAKWRKTGVTGVTPVSQTPVEYYLNDNSKKKHFIDSVGDEWELVVANGEIYSEQLGNGQSAIQLGMFLSASEGYCFIPPIGQIEITSSGNSFNSREYGLLIPSHLKMKGAGRFITEFYAEPSSDIDIITTDRSGVTNEKIELSGFSVRGSGVAGGEGLSKRSLWLANVNDVSLSDFFSYDSAEFGVAFSGCDEVKLRDINTDHVSDINADGIHFIDTSNVTGSNIKVKTSGDDGFIIEAVNKDVENYSISGLISETYDDGLISAGRRAVLLLGDESIMTGHRTIRNINISGVIPHSAGQAFACVGASYENCDINFVIGSSGDAGGWITPGNATYPSATFKNNRIKLLMSDLATYGLYSDDSYATYDNNELSVIISNPSNDDNGTTAVRLYGDSWFGSVVVDYNPNLDKTLFGVGILINGSNCDLYAKCKGASNNIQMRSSSTECNIKLGALSGASASDLYLESGTSEHRFFGGKVNTIQNDSGVFTNKFFGVRGGDFSQLVSADMSINADGTVDIPHGLASTPRIVLATFANAGVQYPVNVTGRDATNITLTITNLAGTPITSGSYNVMIYGSL